MYLTTVLTQARSGHRLMLPTDPYHITECIWQGAYPARATLDFLLREGVKAILNVSGEPVPRYDAGGFRTVLCYPVEDQRRLPDSYVLTVLDAFHTCLMTDCDSIFVHCSAGWNRSPTIVWLYLIACGVPPVEAGRTIEERTLDAVPGHPLLVDDATIRLAVAHGAARYLPLSRPTAILPAPPKNA